MDEDMTYEGPEEHNELGSDIWDVLTDEQKKNFKKLTEKNEDNMNYIG